MKLYDWIYNKLVMSNYKNFDIVPDVNEWNRFLSSLPEPKDCIDKAYNKYLCKKYYYSGKKLAAMRAVGGIIVFFGNLLSRFPVSVKAEPSPKDRLLFEVVKDIDPKDVVPNEVLAAYSETIRVFTSRRFIGRLCRQARTLFEECKKRYPDDVYFHFLVYKDMVLHSHYLKKYNPSATMVYVSERNIASPVITELYEQRGGKFISFMHGDYLLQMIQAYMQFSEYYVWDAAYIDMFVNDLHCDPGQFKIYTPGKLLKKWDLENVTPEYYCTYYFSGCSRDSIGKIADAFAQLRDAGKKCKVRLHPRWGFNDDLIRERFRDFPIEEAKDVSMEQSLASTEYAIGLNSTALHEAYTEGRKVVIDDISSPGDFKSLEDRRYIMLRKEHVLFSGLISNAMDKTE